MNTKASGAVAPQRTWPKRALRAALWGGFLSPQGLALRAGIILLALGVAHALGWREATCVVSGTAPGGGPLTEADVMQGGLYMLAYFAAVVAAPVMLLAAGLQTAALRVHARRRAASR